MKFEMPNTDDRPLWDVWLSSLWMPAVTAADELGLFDTVAKKPGTVRELIRETGFPARGMEILLPLLAALGFLAVRRGSYQITSSTRNYLLKDSPYYWGGLLERTRALSPMHAAVRDAVSIGKGLRATHPAEPNRPADAWASGEIDLERARGVARFMHSHSLPAALGAARHGDFNGVKRLLDVGAGSGCFAITLAQRFPDMRCTIMDLPAMCRVAAGYISEGEVADRVDTRPVDMFRQPWPEGYDAAFFSNIFHDWSFETCAELARKAHAILPPGGRIYLHEMLINDSGDGPLTAAAFSVLMLLGTEGRQFTFTELAELLEQAGFRDVAASATYGYYSLVTGRK